MELFCGTPAWEKTTLGVFIGREIRQLFTRKINNVLHIQRVTQSHPLNSHPLNGAVSAKGLFIR